MGKGKGIGTAYGLREGGHVPSSLLEVCIGDHAGGNNGKISRTVFVPLAIGHQGNVSDLICTVGAIPRAVDHSEGNLLLVLIGHSVRLIAIFTAAYGIGRVNHINFMILGHTREGLAIPSVQGGAVGNRDLSVDLNAIQRKFCVGSKVQRQTFIINNAIDMGSVRGALACLRNRTVYHNYRYAVTGRLIKGQDVGSAFFRKSRNGGRPTPLILKAGIRYADGQGTHGRKRLQFCPRAIGILGIKGKYTGNGRRATDIHPGTIDNLKVHGYLIVVGDPVGGIDTVVLIGNGIGAVIHLDHVFGLVHADGKGCPYHVI